MTRTKHGKFTSYRYVAAGVYDGELKTLSRALRAGDLSVVGRAADILSPLVGDARCIVPMPSRNGLPNAVNALCEAVSSRTGLPVVNALGTKTERVSMCDAKRALRNRTAARLPYPEELMMFRKSDAEAGSAVIIDNVIASGTTAVAALDALGGENDESFVLVLADDYRYEKITTFNNIKISKV